MSFNWTFRFSDLPYFLFDLNSQFYPPQKAPSLEIVSPFNTPGVCWFPSAPSPTIHILHNPPGPIYMQPDPLVCDRKKNKPLCSYSLISQLRLNWALLVWVSLLRTSPLPLFYSECLWRLVYFISSKVWSWALNTYWEKSSCVPSLYAFHDEVRGRKGVKWPFNLSDHCLSYFLIFSSCLHPRITFLKFFPFFYFLLSVMVLESKFCWIPLLSAIFWNLLWKTIYFIGT